MRRVFEHGAYADRALQAEARELGPRDRALAMRLAFGTIQRRRTLDHLIAALADRPPSALDAPLLAAVRLGLYELLYTDGAPDRAVVADAVELAKAAGTRGHGLVNAVLRRATREGGERLARLGDATPESAALAHSHPDWIASLWWQELGAADARALMAADNEPAELALRVNTLRTAREQVEAQLPVVRRCAKAPAPQLAEGIVLAGAVALHETRAWREGAVVAQSRAAMLVAHVLEPQPGERVLDVCAAPGGKATHIAALMEGTGEVLAVERNRRRAQALRVTAARLGAGNLAVLVADARDLRGLEGGFDRVLVDPPCSGLGTLQGHADLRWRMRPERLDALAADQEAMLESAARLLRPGGVLVYSTCTISPTENERLIARFLARRRDFGLSHLEVTWPELAMARTAGAPSRTAGAPSRTAGAHEGEEDAAQVRSGALLTLPHRDRTAGFFIVRLERDSQAREGGHR